MSDKILNNSKIENMTIVFFVLFTHLIPSYQLFSFAVKIPWPLFVVYVFIKLHFYNNKECVAAVMKTNVTYLFYISSKFF